MSLTPFIRLWAGNRNSIEASYTGNIVGYDAIPRLEQRLDVIDQYRASSSLGTAALSYEHRVPLGFLPDGFLTAKVGYHKTKMGVDVEDIVIPAGYVPGIGPYDDITLPIASFETKSSGPLWGVGLAYGPLELGYERLSHSNRFGDTSNFYLGMNYPFED